MEKVYSKKQNKISEKFNRKIRVSRYVMYRETLFDFKEQFWSFLGAFFGIGIIAFFQSQFLLELENILLIGSFGASSVLVYGAIQSPLAQPRNLIGGQVLSAIIGVSIFKLVPEIIWLAAPLAVSLSIIAMQMTRTLHPPGGATALIAVIGTENIQSLGYTYVFVPVLVGTLILLLTALFFNNLTANREYPSKGRLADVVKMRILRNKKEAA